jgi:hypothetical protein
VITPDLSRAALQLPVGRDHERVGAVVSAGAAEVTPVCRAFAKRIAHGAVASTPPRGATATAVRDGVGVLVGVLAGVPENEGVPDGVKLGEAPCVAVGVGEVLGEGVAEGGASAYSVALSENTTVLPASMGEPVMGCAVGVV